MLTAIKPYLLILWVLLFFVACEKPEPLWDLPPAGKETIKQLNLGTNYENVFFFNLKTGQSEMRRVDVWQLGFASGANESHIILNSGNDVQVYDTKDTTFSKTYPTTGKLPWIWDNPNGRTDSTAMNRWIDLSTGNATGTVYILDLGKKAAPRFLKIRILDKTPTSYTFEYACIDNSAFHRKTITKNVLYNYTYYHFKNHETVLFEPSMPWDIVFTKYTHVYYDMTPITPYYVNGVLINTKKVTVGETRTIPFDKMDLTQAKQVPLSTKLDEIGYDWKFFDLNGSGKYLIDAKKVYVLKDLDGTYYKFRFIDFYDETGAKGFPKFAYQRL